MCGIFGIFKINENFKINEKRFKDSLKFLKHRGPDIQKIKLINKNVILGHARLSIIDLNRNNDQPQEIEGRYSIVFNGEIYNFLELRSKLKKKGITFKTKGDTEVLLKSYIYWGAKCVEYFNGMWAFAIYDKKKNLLFCSRDRFGAKPFYYNLSEQAFIFASEIKPLLNYDLTLKKPNYNVIANYCRFSVGVQNNETWFENIKILSPGHNLIINRDKIILNRYWNYPKNINQKINFKKAKREYKKIFIDSVKLRMRSDVKIGITLSSGLDSSTIAYCARLLNNKQKYNTFTSANKINNKFFADKAIYKKEFEVDEFVIAKQLSNDLSLIPNRVSTNYENLINKIRKNIYFLERGTASPAVIPLMQLLKKVKNKKIKVVLDGQGADELLGGYPTSVFIPSILDLLKSAKFNEIFLTIKHYLKYFKLYYLIKIYLRNLSNKYSLISKLYHQFIGTEQIYLNRIKKFSRIVDYDVNLITKNNSNLEKNLKESHSGTLKTLLQYGDSISMANSIEMRNPFLDYRLVKYVFSLPPEFKVKLGIGKFIHRQAFRGIVADRILNNYEKLGFNTSISKELKNFSFLKILLEKKTNKRGLFNTKYLKKIINSHMSQKKDFGSLLYRLISTELWFREFIDKKIKVKFGV